MGQTPDRRPGELIEDEGILLGDAGSDPTQVGEIRRVGTDFRAKDGVGVFSLRGGGGGITEEQHKALDQLVHELAETCYYEVTWDGPRATAETWWTNSGKTVKVREVSYTYDGARCTQELIEQYNGSGTKVATLQIDYTYDGPRVVSADYTYSEP